MRLFTNQIDYLKVVLLSAIFASFFFNWQTAVTDDYPTPGNFAIWENGLSTFWGVISIILTIVILSLMFLIQHEEKIIDNITYTYSGLNLLIVFLYFWGEVNNNRLHCYQKNYLGVGFYLFFVFSFIYFFLILLQKHRQSKKSTK